MMGKEPDIQSKWMKQEAYLFLEEEKNCPPQSANVGPFWSKTVNNGLPTGALSDPNF